MKLVSAISSIDIESILELRNINITWWIFLSNRAYLTRAISFLQQGLMLLLQNLPTSNWSDSEISLLVAEAFRLKYVFADAPNHLQANKKWC